MQFFCALSCSVFVQQQPQAGNFFIFSFLVENLSEKHSLIFLHLSSAAHTQFYMLLPRYDDYAHVYVSLQYFFFSVQHKNICMHAAKRENTPLRLEFCFYSLTLSLSLTIACHFRYNSTTGQFSLSLTREALFFRIFLDSCLCSTRLLIFLVAFLLAKDDLWSAKSEILLEKYGKFPFSSFGCLCDRWRKIMKEEEK